ncbi:conserved hypothetical protein [Perkinsus marinus ATCC 50983]|uniref:Nuclear nucleic acid-binding protein C1D n=1 Tax=Perkinsus marinus (strain ATCC 50983 / TXsc) TaxID=423536 RepID=C5K7R4_PERM5|nr:conserved hypothetical protein [Perkinsus marinus ATCC 50983]EER19599.1 conserved hypothetical protein [Perkinsus marinus ATCC 50983]|eukprot:XP_002787803.1 conserved hypothetical protein [Perkinsus marinus ATCC 50983]
MAASSSSSGVRNSLIKKLDNFEAQLSSLEEHLKPLMDTDYEELMSKMTQLYQVLLILSALEQSELNVSLAFTTASLYWMFLKTQGTDVKTHKIKDEIDRVKSYMARIKKASEQEDAKTRKRDVVLNKDAAARIVKAHTTETTVQSSSKRKAEEAKQEKDEEEPKTTSGKQAKRCKKSA